MLISEGIFILTQKLSDKTRQHDKPQNAVANCMQGRNSTVFSALTVVEMIAKHGMLDSTS